MLISNKQVKTGDFLLNFHNFGLYFNKKERIAQKIVTAEKNVCSQFNISETPKKQTIIGREDLGTRLKTFATNRKFEKYLNFKGLIKV